jgi:hypothetical protein
MVCAVVCNSSLGTLASSICARDSRVELSSPTSDLELVKGSRSCCPVARARASVRPSKDFFPAHRTTVFVHVTDMVK